MECRICLEETNVEDMISPCLCRGTSKYVHRQCLNQWINSSSNEDVKTKCLECRFEYKHYINENSLTENKIICLILNHKFIYLIISHSIAIIGYIILNNFSSFEFSLKSNVFYINNYFFSGLFINLIQLIYYIYVRCRFNYHFKYSQQQASVIHGSIILSLILLYFIPLLTISVNMIIILYLLKYFYDNKNDNLSNYIISLNDEIINEYRNLEYQEMV